jgi:predicted RNA-binding Zn ribbon-like protein
MVNNIAVKAPESNSGSGWLALDFANTAEWHASAHPEEKLTGYDKLVDWAKGHGVLTAAYARSLREQAAKRPTEAHSVLEKSIELREAIYHILADRIRKMPIRASDLRILNRAVADMMVHSQIVMKGNERFAWGWGDGQDNLSSILWPVVRSSVELLTSDDILKRVGQCADEKGCGWLFMDTSKNKSRRWCDMGDCGNRAKARRHYQKLATGKKAG